MFDLDLAPYNLATYHLALVFHITCVQKMAPFMKANAKQKGKECFPKKEKYIKASITVEVGGSNMIHNVSF